MSIPDIYAEATEAGIFDNIYGEQSFENTVIEQPNALEYDEPSIYTTQFSTSPYYLKAPVCSDNTEGEDFSYKYLQPSAPVDELGTRLCDKSITFDNSPIAKSRAISTRSPTSKLKRPATNSARSIFSPPPRIPRTKQVGIQGKKPGKKVTFFRSNGYDPLYVAPFNWDIFEYNSFGELSPGRTYTPQELVRYLYSNPQHHVGETYNPKLGGLTLWVQRTPEDFAADYGHPEAALCRFQNCDHNNKSNNEIKAGEIRVAFDELTKQIPNLNPQRNAGYVHLSCLEKKLNFPMLCKDLEVKAEARFLPLELTHGNPMILQDGGISGGGGGVLEHVQRFIDFCNRMGRPPKSYPDQGRLIDEILQLEAPRIIKLKKIKKGGVKWDEDEDEDDKAEEYQHSKDIMSDLLKNNNNNNNNNRLKKKKRTTADIDIPRPANEKKGVVVVIMNKNKKRAHAENEKKFKSDESAEEEEEEEEEELDSDAPPPRRGAIKKARAIIKHRGRTITRKERFSTPPSPSPSPTPAQALESDSDSDSSALTELDTETESSKEEEEEEDEAPRRKYARYSRN